MYSLEDECSKLHITCEVLLNLLNYNNTDKGLEKAKLLLKTDTEQKSESWSRLFSVAFTSHL